MNLSKKQEYELLASISARGEIPVKFAYLGDGAKKWDKIYSHWEEEGSVTGEETGLIDTHLDSFLGVFKGAKGLNIVDLGCGNGKPVFPLIRKLRDNNMQSTYVGVDISPEMLELVTENMKLDFPDQPTSTLLLDFEKESLADHLLAIKQKTGFPNLLINLGNTLGNYVNVGSVLTNFLESMTLDDYLLVGNGLVNDYNPKRIIDTYNIDLIIDIVTSPAKSLGIFGKQDDFKYLWNDSKKRVEGRILLNNDKSITLAGQHMELKQGDELLVHQSNKYSEPSLTKLFSDIGFRTELLTTTKARSHILALVQPTRYSVA